MEIQRTLNSYRDTEKGEQSWWVPTSRFQNFYKVIKIVWHQHKVGPLDQWVRGESPEINPCLYLISNKSDKINVVKDGSFNQW